MNEDNFDPADARSLDEGTEEAAKAKEAIRKAIREGKVRFGETAKKQLAEKGMTEEDLIAAMLKSVGLDS